MTEVRSVHEIYGDIFDDDEADAILSASLSPRGLNPLLFDLVAGFGLPEGSSVLDVGARDGRYAFELARRFGFRVHGIEPVRRHLDLAAAAPADARVRFDEGVAESLPVAGGSADLIWCRDVLVHVEDLEAAFGEFRRVLTPGGRALVFHMTATDRLEPAEAAFLWPACGVYAAGTDPQRFEAAIAAAGLTVERCIELHGEARERLEEDGAATTSRQLLQVSRMLRNRDAYVEKLGTVAYEYLLADCLWGVYQMIGKLGPRIYVLSAARP